MCEQAMPVVRLMMENPACFSMSGNLGCFLSYFYFVFFLGYNNPCGRNRFTIKIVLNSCGDCVFSRSRKHMFHIQLCFKMSLRTLTIERVFTAGEPRTIIREVPLTIDKPPRADCLCPLKTKLEREAILPLRDNPASIRTC